MKKIINEEAAKYFEENHYVVVTDFISKDMAHYLYDYVKLSASRLAWAEETLIDFDKQTFGTFDDEQAPGDYSKYGDITFDSLLLHKLPMVEFYTGKDLLPNYSYHRLYTQGTELKRHKDRPSCEISTTLCLGYNNSNIDSQKYPDWDWPMFVGPKTGEEGTEGKPVHMKPGDMIIYRGCNLEHWREPLWGLNHAQVFLHYNEKQGEYNILNDGRPMLGLPASYRDYL